MSERNADDRLEGKNETVGGLVIKKKKTVDDEKTSEPSGKSGFAVTILIMLVFAEVC